jgi:ribosomal protein L34E
MPTATLPRTRLASSSTASLVPSTARRAARAYGSTAAPTSVSRTVRPDRSSNSWPSSRSSRRIWALTPGWATWTRSAARVKLASSATATKYSS